MPDSAQQSLLDQFSSPGAPEATEREHRMKIAVFFTSQEATSAAMQWAGEFARGLNAHISLFDFQPVPRQLALDRPPISPKFAKDRLQAIADSSHVETTAHVYWCRCPLEAVRSLLGIGALIIIGYRKRWWPTRETKLVKKLRQAGYEVVVYASR